MTYSTAAVNYRKTLTKHNRELKRNVDDNPWYGNKTASQRLLHCAECFGMTPAYVAEFPDMLKTFKLTPAKINSLVLARANRLSAQWRTSIRERVYEMNGGHDSFGFEKASVGKKRRKKKESKPTAPKRDKDKWGSKEGTGCWYINKALHAGATTIKEVKANCEDDYITSSRIACHIRTLLKKGLLVGDSKGFSLPENAPKKKARRRRKTTKRRS